MMILKNYKKSFQNVSINSGVKQQSRQKSQKINFTNLATLKSYNSSSIQSSPREDPHSNNIKHINPGNFLNDINILRKGNTNQSSALKLQNLTPVTRGIPKRRLIIHKDPVSVSAVSKRQSNPPVKSKMTTIKSSILENYSQVQS